MTVGALQEWRNVSREVLDWFWNMAVERHEDEVHASIVLASKEKLDALLKPRATALDFSREGTSNGRTE